MSGRTARFMRMGDMKLVRITTSRSSGVWSVTILRLPMAALFTRQSSPPKVSQASWTSATAASTSDRSTTHRRDSGAYSRHRARVSARRSARRAAIPTVAPRAASMGARAWPIPDDAPVTRMRAPSILMAVDEPATGARMSLPLAGGGLLGGATDRSLAGGGPTSRRLLRRGATRDGPLGGSPLLGDLARRGHLLDHGGGLSRGA